MYHAQPLISVFWSIFHLLLAPWLRQGQRRVVHFPAASHMSRHVDEDDDGEVEGEGGNRSGHRGWEGSREGGEGGGAELMGGSRIDYRQDLDLSGRHLSFLPSHHLASTYVSLTTLDISGNAITRLEGLPQTLTSLYASNNLLRAVSGLDESYSLATLVLDHNSIPKLSGLDNCTALVELSVGNNDLRSLSGLECCVSLTRVNAASNHIASIESLRTLSLNTKLSWMALRYASLTPPLSHLLASPHHYTTPKLRFPPFESNTSHPSHEFICFAACWHPGIHPSIRMYMHTSCVHSLALLHSRWL